MPNSWWLEAQKWAADLLESRGIDATANPDIVDAVARTYILPERAEEGR